MATTESATLALAQRLQDWGEVGEGLMYSSHVAAKASDALRQIRPRRLPRHYINNALLPVAENSDESFYRTPRSVVRWEMMILLAESGEHMPVNIGNPTEMSLLELAEAVLAATGSSSQIVYEALPVDDPQVRQPDITRAKQLLGWEPEVSLDEGLRRTLASLGRDPARA